MARFFDSPIHSSDASLERVLGAGLPVLLVFVDGAAPKPLQDAMARLARQEAGKLLVVQVTMADNPASTRRFGVQRATAVVAVDKGQAVSSGEGITAQDLEKHGLYLLGKGPKPEAGRAPSQHQAESPRGSTYPGNGSPQADKPITVTDTTFEREVLASPQPVLVDFWAPWCGPCRMTEPILEKLARELSGRARIVKVNVDENPVSMQRYGIQSIPTMMVVKDGRILDRWAGALPEGALRSRIAPLIR